MALSNAARTSSWVEESFHSPMQCASVRAASATARLVRIATARSFVTQLMEREEDRPGGAPLTGFYFVPERLDVVGPPGERALRPVLRLADQLPRPLQHLLVAHPTL